MNLQWDDCRHWFRLVTWVHCTTDVVVTTGKHALLLKKQPTGHWDAFLTLPEGHRTGGAVGRDTVSGVQSPFTELLQSPQATLVIQDVAELTRAYTPG